MPVIKLFYKDKEYIEERKLQLPGSEQAILVIKQDEKIAELIFTPEITFVDRKVAERQAQSICKSGFLLESGERIGIGCTLVVS